MILCICCYIFGVKLTSIYRVTNSTNGNHYSATLRSTRPERGGTLYSTPSRLTELTDNSNYCAVVLWMSETANRNFTTSSILISHSIHCRICSICGFYFLFQFLLRQLICLYKFHANVTLCTVCISSKFFGSYEEISRGFECG